MRALTFTKSVTLKVTAEQLAVLRSAASDGNVARYLRVSFLMSVGRIDLLGGESVDVGRVLKQLEPRDGYREHMLVRLTAEQHKLVKATARERGVSLSHVLRAAGIAAAGMDATPGERVKGRPGRMPGALAKARGRRKAPKPPGLDAPTGDGPGGGTTGPGDSGEPL